MANENPPEIQTIANVLNTFLRWKSLNGPPRGHEVFHPSAFGSCLRRMQYQRYAERGHVKVEPQAFEAKTVRIFDTGHATHARWAKYWEELGVLRGIWECTNACCALWDNDGHFVGPPKDYPNPDRMLHVPGAGLDRRIYGKENKLGVFKPAYCVCGCTDFSYHEITVEDKELNFYGHVDQLLDFSNFEGGAKFKKGNPVKVLFKDEDLPKKIVLNDMKSINSFGYKSKLERGSPFNYRVQVNIYIHILGLDYGMLYFENKDDSSTKIFHVEKDEALWQKIKEQARNMIDMTGDLLLPPPRPWSQDDYECRYCEFQPICHKAGVWNDPALEDKRRKFYGDFS
jgi:hypothetical protein